MGTKLKSPVITVEIEVNERVCPEVAGFLEQGQFQAKMEIIDWYRSCLLDGTDLQQRISVKIPR